PRVPDIVVTLAMLFVWAGVALQVLQIPGGGAPLSYLQLGTGHWWSQWIPSGLVILLLGFALLWLPLRWARPGLALYSVGSNRNAAYLSGVSVARTRIFAYALGGRVAGLAWLALTSAAGAGKGRAHECGVAAGRAARGSLPRGSAAAGGEPGDRAQLHLRRALRAHRHRQPSAVGEAVPHPNPALDDLPLRGAARAPRGGSDTRDAHRRGRPLRSDDGDRGGVHHVGHGPRSGNWDGAAPRPGPRLRHRARERDR